MRNIVFKDQPNGQCIRCKWNMSNDEVLNCECPTTHITNYTCILKRTMTIQQNIYFVINEEC